MKLYHVLKTNLMLLLLLVIFCAELHAAPVGKVTGYPIPRFVSLGSNEINLRRGPGTKFPIAWVYQRKGFPVEVIDEWVNWRHIKDRDGVSGWVHMSLLSGKRTAVITVDQTSLFTQPRPESRIKARINRDVITSIETCELTFCSVRVDGFSGWISKTDFYGAYPSEQFADD